MVTVSTSLFFIYSLTCYIGPSYPDLLNAARSSPVTIKPYIMAALHSSGESNLFKLLTALYHEFHVAFVYYANNFVNDLHIAENIVMDSYLTLLKKEQQPLLQSLNKEDLKKYLRITIRNKAIDECRKMKRRGRTLELPETIFYPHPTEEEQAQHEQENKLLAALDEVRVLLGDVHFRILVLYYSKGYSHKQIAQMLQMPVTQVENSLKRSRKKIKKHFLK